MQAHEKALDHLTCDELDTPQLRERGGVEKVGARAGRPGRGSEFCHGSQGSYRWTRVLSTVIATSLSTWGGVGCAIEGDPVSSIGDAGPEMPMNSGGCPLARQLPEEGW